MTNTREKLIELVGQVQDCGCDVTDVVEMNYVENITLVDHLIANGVIIKSDCEDCASKTTRIIDKLHGEIAELRRVQQWIPVTERLPEFGRQVLITDGRYVTRGYVLNFIIKGVSPWCTEAPVMPHTITHWMPLPHYGIGDLNE